MSKQYEIIRAISGLDAGGPDIEDCFRENLSIALCCYFDSHHCRPEDDPIGDHGWGEWVALQCDETLKNIAIAIERDASEGGGDE